MSQKRSEELKERPLGELLGELSQGTATLVRQELDLAKAELTEKGKKAGAGAGMFAAAGVVGLLTLGAFTAFLILALALLIPAWTGALVVAVVYAVIAGILGLRGKKKVQEASPPLPQTVETVKEDIQWAKTQTKSAKR
jgi:hypothetical protein